MEQGCIMNKNLRPLLHFLQGLRMQRAALPENLEEKGWPNGSCLWILTCKTVFYP